MEGDKIKLNVKPYLINNEYSVNREDYNLIEEGADNTPDQSTPPFIHTA